jgi:hypothetical protein
MQRWVDQGLVSIDDGEFAGDPVAAVSALAVHLLEEAQPAVDQLHRALTRAQGSIAYASYGGEVTDADGANPVD